MSAYSHPQQYAAPAMQPTGLPSRPYPSEEQPMPSYPPPMLQPQSLQPVPQQQHEQFMPPAQYQQPQYAGPPYPPPPPAQYQYQYQPSQPSTPMDVGYPLGEPYAGQTLRPAPGSRTPSHHSSRSHKSSRSHRSHHSHDERTRRHKKAAEARPTIGDSVVLIWDSIRGAFSNSR